jgi:CRISPR-associated exonuclease Cas4
MYQEADLLPLSGIQHLLFCERQWGLIHIEQQWEENRLTAEGRLLHTIADSPIVEQRGGVRTVRALPLRSFRLGLSGKADVVEFPLNGDAPVPVEYKRGRAKFTDVDKVQLCAQGLCLEEMLGVRVPQGALFYGLPRRRTLVEFKADLRAATEALARRMHELYAAAITPPPVLLPHCRNCSLAGLCQPSAMTQRGSARTFLRRALRSNMQATWTEADEETA